MNGIELGKITHAEFGKVSDYPFLVGLKLTFEGPGWGCSDGGMHTVNISPECRWESQERAEAIASNLERINTILEEARVYDISQLVGKPVAVTFENNTFKSFRILTEVL